MRVQALSLSCGLSQHDGDAVVLVSLPVQPLTLLAAVGDGATLATLLLASSLATSGADGSVTQLFRHLKIMKDLIKVFLE